MKRYLKSCLILMTALVTLSACGKENFKEQKDAILKGLESKYSASFSIVDIAKRATSDLNSQGDIYYAYVMCNTEDEKLQNKGFYCEINSSLSNLQDSYLDICLQAALEGRYERLVPENAVVVGLLSTQGKEIISKYTYKNIVSNKIPYTIDVIIPIAEDMVVTINGDIESTKFEKFFEEVSNSSNVNANIVYCDESYAQEYKDFINHIKPFDYKVEYDKIYADASISTENGGNFQEQFIRQINNDLLALEADR